MIGGVRVREFHAGQVVGDYTITRPQGFCNLLPYATINPGHPNAGVQVILTHPALITPRPGEPAVGEQP